jgi:AraC family transcriptional regulator
LLADTENSASHAKPPPWLDQLRCELEQTALASVDVGARARAAGAHISHASRLFRRCYGASITQHAQAQSVRRALARLAAPEQSLSEIALAAGFYDQSHMNRVFRRITGRTPAACRALMAAAC